MTNSTMIPASRARVGAEAGHDGPATVLGPEEDRFGDDGIVAVPLRPSMGLALLTWFAGWLRGERTLPRLPWTIIACGTDVGLFKVGLSRQGVILLGVTLAVMRLRTIGLAIATRR